MFRIGVFARLCQISVRTLRLYDEMGLIKPALVDDESGYRFYAVEQLRRVYRILALKDLGLSLEQIAVILGRNDGTRPLPPETIRTLLEEKRQELCTRVQEEQERLARVEDRLRQIEREKEAMPEYEVVLKRLEPQLVASVRDTIPDMGQTNAVFNRLFDEVESHIAKTGGPSAFAGPGLDLWHDDAEKGSDLLVEACLPITKPLPETDRVKSVTLPAVERAATTLYHGGFEKISEGHQAVIEWAERNGYRIAGPNREVYLQYERAGDPAKWVTEIQYPVEKV